MKKIFLFILINISVVFANAQMKNGKLRSCHEQDITPGKNANQFFNSYEDYKANKPIDGIVLYRDNDNHFKFSYVEVIKNGVKEKIDVDKLQYAWFCDESGMLMHVIKGDIYDVVVDGPLCYYYRADGAKAWKLDTGGYDMALNLLSNSVFKEYYSETITGEIKVFKEKILEPYLEKYGLMSQYENEVIKKGPGDYEFQLRCKHMNKSIKYMMLLNEKMK